MSWGLSCTAVLLAMDPSCYRSLGMVNQGIATNYRNELIRDLQKSNALAAIRIHPDGSQTPVVLVNKETLQNPIVQNLLNQSLGFGMDIHYDPGSLDIDHGLMRISDSRLINYVGHGGLMEKDPAGNMKYGSREMNLSAMQHRDFSTYINRFQKPESMLLELAFLSSPDEIALAQAYHNFRRARVLGNVMESTLRYEAGGNPANVGDWLKNLPRMMNRMDLTENCVSYCIGSTINPQLDWMKWKIGEMHLDSNEILNTPKIKILQELARTQLAAADWKNPQILHPEMLATEASLSLIDQATPGKNLSPEQKRDLIAYVVGYDLAEQYKKIVQAQGSNNFVGEDNNFWDHRPRSFSNKHPELDSQNPRSVAVLVFTAWPDAPSLIQQGKFEYRGRAHGIYRTENSPSGFKQVPLSGNQK